MGAVSSGGATRKPWKPSSVKELSEHRRVSRCSAQKPWWRNPGVPRRVRGPSSQRRDSSEPSMKDRASPVQDGQARFNELLDACERDGSQIVTRRGEETAVLVPIKECRRLRRAARPSLKGLLLTGLARAELTIPTRGCGRRRTSGVA